MRFRIEVDNEHGTTAVVIEQAYERVAAQKGLLPL